MLREHQDSLFHFIRVQFVDENYEPAFFNEHSTYILEVIEQFLSEDGGIQIGNRRLCFMAYANSMLKHKSFWFLCENDPIIVQTEKGSYKTVVQKRIASIGNIENARNALKRYARIG